VLEEPRADTVPLQATRGRSPRSLAVSACG